MVQPSNQIIRTASWLSILSKCCFRVISVMYQCWQHYVKRKACTVPQVRIHLSTVMPNSWSEKLLQWVFFRIDIISKKELLAELDSKWNLIAPHMLMYNYSVSSQEEKDRVSATLKKYYFDGKPLSIKNSKQLIQVWKMYGYDAFLWCWTRKLDGVCFAFLQAYGDRAFYNDIVRAMKIQASKSKSDIYCYKFSYRGKYSLSNLLSKDSTIYGKSVRRKFNRTKCSLIIFFWQPGVSHADDVSYVVDLIGFNMTETSEDRAMSDLLNKMVGNFMRCGLVKFSIRMVRCTCQFPPISTCFFLSQTSTWTVG